jgi:hypothetical protein
MKTYKTIEEALTEWDSEDQLGDPRFTFKHAIRLQGLFLGDDNQIYDSKGRLYATLGETKWKDQNTIQATLKLATGIKFVVATIDIGKLK